MRSRSAGTAPSAGPRRRRVTGWQAQHAEHEAEEAAPEGNRDPGEDHHEDREERQLGDLDAVARQHLPHQERAERRRRDDEDGQQ